jgi:hypothetical protein
LTLPFARQQKLLLRDSYGLGRVDGVAKVTGATLDASDFRAADLPGWPAQTSHAMLHPGGGRHAALCWHRPRSWLPRQFCADRLLAQTRRARCACERELPQMHGFGSRQIHYGAAPAALGAKEKRKAAFLSSRRAMANTCMRSARDHDQASPRSRTPLTANFRTLLTGRLPKERGAARTEAFSCTSF